MSPERLEYFKNMSEVEKLALAPSDFLVSELRILFDEMTIKEECKQIAILRFINAKTLEEISDIVGVDKKTVKERLKKIEHNFKFTCIRYFYKK